MDQKENSGGKRDSDLRLSGILSKTTTFFSVDVADSTGMKLGEAEEDVIFSFLAYQKLVTQSIEQGSGRVVSITGDGVMGRFVLAKDAVETAVALVRSVRQFNASLNHLKVPFRIRVGVNTGSIYEDAKETTASLQILPSSAIDLAGYMQKHAPVNGVWFSQFSIEQCGAVPDGIRKSHFDEKVGLAIYVYEGAGKDSDRRPVPARTGKRRILIIEDEPDLAYALEAELEAAGHLAHVCFDGGEGLMSMRLFEPDLVLLDIGLPRVDGWHVLHELKANKLAPKVPVLMLARRYKVDDIEQSFKMGASGCLKKPCDQRALLKKTSSLLSL